MVRLSPVSPKRRSPEPSATRVDQQSQRVDEIVFADDDLPHRRARFVGYPFRA